MDESTTTAAPADDGANTAQPDGQTGNTAAENPTTESTQAAETSTEAVSIDDNLKWLQDSKGIDLSTTEGQAKAAAMYREAEKKIHETTQAKAQLQTALQQPEEAKADAQGNPTAELAIEVQNLKMERQVERFFSQNPDAKAYEEKMTEMVLSDPNLGALVQANYLGVEQLYNMARGADPSLEASLKTQGGREALQQVADKQQAKAVAGNATTSAMAGSGPNKANFDTWYAGLSPADRAKPETQAIVADLLSQ